MLITKKSDYAVRIIRILQDGNIHNITEICTTELVPKAFAYKILRELEAGNLVTSERGNKGGYRLDVSLDDITLYDIVLLTEAEMSILHCMEYGCERNTPDEPCCVHKEIARVQQILVDELKSKSMREVLNNR